MRASKNCSGISVEIALIWNYSDSYLLEKKTNLFGRARLAFGH